MPFQTTPHPRTMGQKKKIPDEMVPSVPDSMSMSLGSASTTIEESSIITQSASKSYYRRPQPPPGTTHSRSQNQNRKVRSKFQPVSERLGCNVPVDAYKSSKPQVAMNRLMAAPRQPVRPPVRKTISTPFRARARMIKSANSQYTTDVTRLISDASTPVNGMAIALILTSRETATNTSHISTTACVINSNLIGEESAPKEKEGNPHNDNSEADGYFSDEEKVGERDIGNQNEADNVFVQAYEDSEGDDYEDDYYDDDDDDDIGPEYLSPSTADGRKGAGIEHGTLSPCVPTSMPVPISVLYDSDAETVRRYHSPIEPTIPISKALSRHNINKKTTGIALTESVQLSFKSLLI